MIVPSTRPTATQGLDDLRVADVMHRGVVTCGRGTSLVAVARIMAAHRVHCVAVVAATPSGEQALWGVVSDRDVLAAVVRGEISEATAGTSAATEVVTVTPEEPLRRAAEAMDEHGVTHIVVVEPGTRTPTGVVSTLDVAEVVERAWAAPRTEPAG
jgi:CBS domain-containing protein